MSVWFVVTDLTAPSHSHRSVLKSEGHGGPLGREVEADGAPLMACPQISRQAGLGPDAMGLSALPGLEPVLKLGV